MYSLIRWVLFLCIGLPIQLILYVLYPLAILIVDLFAKEPGDPADMRPFLAPSGTLEDRVARGKAIDLRDKYFENDMDGHTALVHASLWSLPDYRHLALPGLTRLMTPEGSLVRRYPVDAETPLSIDCLSSWCHAYVVSGVKAPNLVFRIAKHYLINCLGLAWTNKQVSTRCSNSGVNFAFDGWQQMSQPASGHNYYASAALFALAAKETSGLDKIWWNFIYYAHFLIMGGWLWWIRPILHIEWLRGRSIYYPDHITALNLYVLNKAKPSNLSRRAFRNLIKYGTKYRNCNPFFFASAIDCGALTSKDDWEYAKDTLLTLRDSRGLMWQEKPTNRYYLSMGGHGQWSHVAMVAHMLLRNKK